MRAVFYQFVLALAFQGLSANAAEAEEFKYYVWIDEEGIVHAEEEAPKGVDYQVRIIEDINANVVPAEDFRLYGDIPVDYGDGSSSGEPASGNAPESGDTGQSTARESADPDSPETQR